jgi:N-acetylglutamate synthase-like GNAT family acetyltransferase
VITIRRARVEDATAIAALLITVITEACAEDHKNDPTLIERWCNNKTSMNVARWIDETSSDVFVAHLSNGAVVGVGALARPGQITLCYVLPSEQRKGIGSALIDTLENRALERSFHRLFLDSTATAHKFYLSRGYQAAGGASIRNGMQVHPLSKDLSVSE